MKFLTVVLSLVFLSFKTAQSNELATVAGGCFWGMEEIIRQIPGVISTRVGYTGGTLANATYDLVSSGTSGHAESVEVVFDPKKITYKKFLSFFFRMHDPTTLNQQGNDKGTQYRSVIFYHSPDQKRIAEEAIFLLNNYKKLKKPVATQVTAAGKFYLAEKYHQNYLQKNPGGYTCHFLRPE